MLKLRENLNWFVKSKYPHNPSFSYETCRRSRNQMMRDSTKGSHKLALDNLGSHSLESDYQNSHCETDEYEDQVYIV